MLPNDLSGELNPEQIKVVTTSEGPMLVLAGAGSGKTKSIIYRAAWLLHKVKVPPWNILIVTFTNKAARELQDLLEALLHYSVRSLWVGTFHSLCTRILRFESAHLPFGANFSIYDDDDQKSVLKKIYKAHGYDNQKIPIARVMSTIGKYKNKLMLPEDLSEKKEEVGAYGDFYHSFLQIYTLYQQNLLLNQALDFDDILLFTARLLKENELVRKKYQSSFRYIMIDEYQDTNYAQFQIVYQIARDHGNICVVGDDDQAIYSWRGATIRNILEFERDYGTVQTIRLEQNYRSTTAILDLANAVIKNNHRRHEKQLWSELGTGEPPTLESYEDENAEANKTAEKILELNRKGLPLGKIAILYRTNAQSRVFEYVFMQKKLPYTIVGSLYFYQRKEIKDLLGYLKVISNPADNESLLRIINEPPRGIGQTTVNRLIAHAAKLRISLYQALAYSTDIPDMQKAARERLASFFAKLEEWRILGQKANVLVLVKGILEDLNWIELYRDSKDQKDIARSENLIEFVTATSEFSERFQRENERLPQLQDYLPHIALQTDLDQLSDAAETVKLMTMHNAKGLEFEAVFIVGLENELLPHRMSMDSKEAIEEERRLFYVAVTRARRQLFLSYARFRRLYDTFYYTQASMFVQELDASLFRGSENEMAF
ncbi:MAG: 3'-5' exonuclease, partial [Candidatus Cloacimonadaceae bacterium]|nr:3'-5' exonuclease [Candidatus Cloacimonadaceae bacterium]